MPSRRKRVAFVGAGTIGRSWATLYAGKGYEVTLQDRDPDALSKAREVIASNFRSIINYGLISRVNAKASIRRVEYTSDLAKAVAGASLVQESVPESLPLKRQIFSQISSLVSRDVIIASSSGGLLMSKIQSAAKAAERCVIIHPCQLPVHLTRLVEIVPGKLTSERTVRFVSDLMRKVGKQPITMGREVPDYITNRLQFTLFREAVDMVGRGIASAQEIDTALCEFAKGSFCAGLGPFVQAHIHGGPYGAGGIDACMDYYARILPDTWADLAKWTRIPASVKRGVNRSVHKMIRKRGMTDKQLANWRDRCMLELAREVWTK